MSRQSQASTARQTDEESARSAGALPNQCYLRRQPRSWSEPSDDSDLIDALLEKHRISQEAVLGENGLTAQVKKRVVERGPCRRVNPIILATPTAPEEVESHRNSYNEETVVGEGRGLKIE